MDISSSSDLIGIVGYTVIILWIGFKLGRIGQLAQPIDPINPDQVSASAKAAMADAMDQGRKIEAIKIIRAETGAGLREAKYFVETRSNHSAVPPRGQASR